MKFEVLRRQNLKTGTTKLIHMGLVPTRIWGHGAPGVSPTQRLQMRGQVAEMLGKKKQASLDIF